MKELEVLVSDVNEPYKTIDISGYDTLYIKGHTFPCETEETESCIPLKEPQLYIGMIDRLKKYVSFDNDEERIAEEILKRINYYKLSIFTKLLDDNRTFSRLVELYEFDVFLKKELILLLKEIENLFKARFAYFMVNNYSELCKSNTKHSVASDENNLSFHSAEFYLDYKIYATTEREKIDKIISKFAESVLSKKDKELYIKHHIVRYGGHIPFWVLVETLTFGQIIHFYSYISKEIRRKWKDSFFVVNVPKESEIEWLKTLQFLRNDCAHDNRLYGRTFNFTPVLHKNDMEKIFGKKETDLSLLKKRKVQPEELENFDKIKIKIEKTKKTLFSGLVIMRYFIESSTKDSKNNWNEFLLRLEEEIKLKNIPLMRIGFRTNWKDILWINI